MKIIHIAPNAPYNEGWSYQENLLPKYQAKLGHDVSLVITNHEHRDGKILETACSDHITSEGFRVIRLKQKRSHFPILNRTISKLNVFDILVKEHPDFIFYHGMVSATIFQVCRYKNKINQNCIIVQDNHLDSNIGFNLHSIKGLIFKTIFSCIFRMTRSNVEKVYGVTPWRAKYAQMAFSVPSDMTDVLIMGADDTKINFKDRDNIRCSIRKQYGVADDDFLVVTGGKIDASKKIHLLMEACKGMDKIELIIFGQVNDDVKQVFDNLLVDNKNLIYVGWIQSDKAYDYFFAADLVCFPGQHSVLWEQACAAKVPCVFGKWEGMEHVNNGGNSRFVDPVTIDTLRNELTELHFTEKYKRMKEVAESEATDIYLYSRIAEKSLECAQ